MNEDMKALFEDGSELDNVTGFEIDTGDRHTEIGKPGEEQHIHVLQSTGPGLRTPN